MTQLDFNYPKIRPVCMSSRVVLVISYTIAVSVSSSGHQGIPNVRILAPGDMENVYMVRGPSDPCRASLITPHAFGETWG